MKIFRIKISFFCYFNLLVAIKNIPILMFRFQILFLFARFKSPALQKDNTFIVCVYLVFFITVPNFCQIFLTDQKQILGNL